MIHVFPMSEQHSHNLTGIHCECGPEIDWDEEIVVHNSLNAVSISDQIDAMIRNIGCFVKESRIDNCQCHIIPIKEQ